MPRPSSHIDRRLIEAALEMMPTTGLTGLKIRRLASKARVNLGMFHYHFKTKNDFVRRVLAEAYEGFLQRLQSGSVDGATAEDRLRSALRVLGRFARDHRPLLVALLADALAGDRTVGRFFRENAPRHLSIVARLIRDSQAEGSIRPAPVSLVMSVLGGCIGFPNLILGFIERTGAARKGAFSTGAFERDVLSDAALEERIDMVFRALGPAPRRTT